MSPTDRDVRTGGEIAALFSLIQAIVATVAVGYVWFGGLAAPGCAGHCDYVSAYDANLLMLWVGVGLTALLIVLSVVLRARRWRIWPIAASGLAVTIALAVLCWFLQSWALRP